MGENNKPSCTEVFNAEDQHGHLAGSQTQVWLNLANCHQWWIHWSYKSHIFFSAANKTTITVNQMTRPHSNYQWLYWKKKETKIPLSHTLYWLNLCSVRTCLPSPEDRDVTHRSTILIHLNGSSLTFLLNHKSSCLSKCWSVCIYACWGHFGCDGSHSGASSLLGLYGVDRSVLLAMHMH